MAKAILHSVLITAMLFALVGQTLAKTASHCEMPPETNPHSSHSYSHNSVQDHGMDHHSMMQGQSEMDNCCEIECSCPSSACGSQAQLSSTPISFIFDSSITKELQHLTGPIKSAYGPLYRPPIFA